MVTKKALQLMITNLAKKVNRLQCDNEKLEERIKTLEGVISAKEEEPKEAQKKTFLTDYLYEEYLTGVVKDDKGN